MDMKKCGRLATLTALALIFGCFGAARAEILPAHGEGQIGLQAVVICESLSVRQGPGSDYQAVSTLEYGDTIIVQPETGGWAECFLSDSVDEGPAGWVNEDYLAIDPAWYRTEEKTPVYAWNEETAPRVALLDGDTTLPILKADGEWLIVSLRGATGWIHVPGAGTEAAGTDGQPEAEAGRQDGERFEGTIMIEGMEETVAYEHAVNAALGIEMDYDCEGFERQSEPERERFVWRYDEPGDPQNYLEVTRRAEDADAASAAIGEALSQEYDITLEPCALDRAGSCVRINAFCVRGADETAEIMQSVYVIPAGDGCVVATARCYAEGVEGFGPRFDAMIETLEVAGGAD